MHELLFEVGQLAETRTSAIGFRGAWFRCKIEKIREKNGKLFYRVEYVDYPDQNLEWIKVYQKPRNKKCPELRVRPCYPTIHLESDMPNMSTISEEVVIIDGIWMIGDLVDFLADGCYWSGTVIKILEDGKFMIELFAPPKGEGSSYDASYKDLRPSLDWDPKKGWKVPKAFKGGKRRTCARLIKPQQSDKDVVVQTSLSASLPRIEPDSENPEGCIQVNNNTKTGMDVEVGDLGTKKANCSGDGLSTPNLAESAENMQQQQQQSLILLREVDYIDDTGENMRMKEINELFNEQPSKKLRKDKNIRLDSMFLHKIEDAILDLEDLINRVKWMKGLLKVGMPMSSVSQSFWDLKQRSV